MAMESLGEQVSFKSSAETDQQLCDPDIGRDLVPPLSSQDRVAILQIDLCFPLGMAEPGVHLR